MRRLLYVNASSRGTASESWAIAEEFLATYLERSADVVVDVLELWTEAHPVYRETGVAAGMQVFAREPAHRLGRAPVAVR